MSAVSARFSLRFALSLCLVAIDAAGNASARAVAKFRVVQPR